MRQTIRLSALLLALAMAASGADALTLKLGSVVPKGSPWELALRRLSAEWARISEGSIAVQVYPAGAAGDESDMIRKMRIGQIQAALVTVSGLQQIWNGVKALSYPLFIKDDAEFQYVMEGFWPLIDRELEARGFKAVFWSPGGWVYFFTRLAVTQPEDLRRQRLWVWGDPDEVLAWQSMGFQVVPLPSLDVTTSLSAGMIDGMMTSPLLAASNQWFGVASNMAGLKLSPLWGALIISARTWEAVPARLRPQLLEAAGKATAELAPEIAQADDAAVAVMRKYGLRVTEIPPAARAEWEDVVSRGMSLLEGTAYDRAAIAAARKLIAEYRSAAGKR
ncbi:MAG: TRAP transporter substrate-binding protein DctP [Spirochaetes bacterium]|nr:TRAP transporter substrate-binding protein DctP [Spirochaetota bacterium]